MKTSPHKRDNNEVQAARGRLRGALNDSLQNQEVDDIPEDYEEEEEEEEQQQIIPHRQRGRPKKIQSSADRLSPSAGFLTPSKRRKREHHQAGGSGGQKIQAESFVMKLFDRSLDLSKYSEQTSLYPICRAWMANQPRNPSIRSYRDARSPSPTERKDNGLELLAKLRKGDMRDVCSMPKPKKTDVPKIPTPTVEPKKYSKSEELVADNNELKDGSKEELLAQHLGKWKQVKSDWQKHTKVYQKRHEVSYQILELLFKP
ncbi:protein lin-37 homolog [Lucilia sericata]|uniref:protein lin-37 homolog n=1 Tax=Lucilia sericata TaxID=13632 RepID=UPI0018A808CE|nr:protein lin-37 homolog [Lucilia sericata]